MVKARDTVLSTRCGERIPYTGENTIYVLTWLKVPTCCFQNIFDIKELLTFHHFDAVKKRLRTLAVNITKIKTDCLIRLKGNGYLGRQMKIH